MFAFTLNGFSVYTQKDPFIYVFIAFGGAKTVVLAGFARYPLLLLYSFISFVRIWFHSERFFSPYSKGPLYPRFYRPRGAKTVVLACFARYPLLLLFSFVSLAHYLSHVEKLGVLICYSNGSLYPRFISSAGDKVTTTTAKVPPIQSPCD